MQNLSFLLTVTKILAMKWLTLILETVFAYGADNSHLSVC